MVMTVINASALVAGAGASSNIKRITVKALRGFIYDKQKRVAGDVFDVLEWELPEQLNMRLVERYESPAPEVMPETPPMISEGEPDIPAVEPEHSKQGHHKKGRKKKT
jgi:hypothetical protein